MTTKTEPTPGAPLLVPVDQVKPSEDNVRLTIGNLDPLAKSIRADGIIQPLVVAPENGHYRIIAGARRYAAALKVGLTEIPVTVRAAVDDTPRAELMLIENLMRDDLNAREEALGYQRLVNDHGYSQRKIGDRVGCSQSHVTKRLALLQLPDSALDALDSGGITLVDAQELLKVADDPELVDAAIKEAPHFARGVSGSVAAAIEQKNRATKLAAAIERAEKDPAPYVPSVKTQYHGDEVPKGSMRLGTADYAYGSKLPITPAKHRKAACHAVTVLSRGYGDPELAYICTKPANHPDELAKANANSYGPRKGPLSEDEKKARAAKRVHNKEIREAETTRREFLRTELAKPQQPDADVVAAVVGVLLSRNDGGDRFQGAIACALLGVQVSKPENTWDNTARERNHRALAAFGLKTKANLARVALAIVAEFSEAHIDTSNPWGWTRDNVKAHFKWLADRGYKASPAEKVSLAGKAPR